MPLTEEPTQFETDDEENSEENLSEEDGDLLEENNEGGSVQPGVETENIEVNSTISITIGGESEGSVGSVTQLETGTVGIGQVGVEEVQISGSTSGELQTGSVNQGSTIVEEESSEEGLGLFEESEEESESQEEELVEGENIFEGGNQENLATEGGTATILAGNEQGISAGITGEGALELNGTVEISGNVTISVNGNEGSGINVEESTSENSIEEEILQVNGSEEISLSINGSITGTVSQGGIVAESLEGGLSAEEAISIDGNEVEGIDLSTEEQIDQNFSAEGSEEQESGEIEVDDSQVEVQENIIIEENNLTQFENGGLGNGGGEKMHKHQLSNNYCFELIFNNQYNKLYVNLVFVLLDLHFDIKYITLTLVILFRPRWKRRQ